jgi:hypothetical protein
VALLGLTLPAQAQFRDAVPEYRASARLYDSGAAGFLLNKVFNPSVFRMSHSFEMSVGSFGGNTSSLGMYTNTLAWQFNNKLAARVDVSMAYSPLNNGVFDQGNQSPRVFLRNAEIAYRPSENIQFHFQVRQSPYGRYMSPYGTYSPYGMSPYGYHNALMYGGYGGPSPDLFWKDS